MALRSFQLPVLVPLRSRSLPVLVPRADPEAPSPPVVWVHLPVTPRLGPEEWTGSVRGGEVLVVPPVDVGQGDQPGRAYGVHFTPGFRRAAVPRAPLPHFPATALANDSDDSSFPLGFVPEMPAPGVACTRLTRQPAAGTPGQAPRSLGSVQCKHPGVGLT